MSAANLYRPGRYAAIDIGTVTARLLVADVSEDGAIEELHRDQAICNLGVGVDKTGRLDPAAIDRVEAVIARFVNKLGELAPTDGSPLHVTSNATSASRDAENSADFVAVLAKHGVELQVIPGEREAALSFAGATSAFPGQRVIVVDIGGGSTEIIAGQAGATPQFAHSFNIGCRRVTERFFHHDPPLRDELNAAGTWIADEMRDYLQRIADGGYEGCRIVAVAGTATSIISMKEQMREYDSSRVHGAVATRDDVEALLDKLGVLDLEGRKQVVGLDPGRAPVIVAGLVIMKNVLELAHADSYTASERDILHGIILDSAAR